ncbi:MAG: hypothetical protein IJ643_11705 [Eubacterium sp.]|nr:hypothetical protein [Eubacterium sp.]MBR1761910.1 hypothetical protein [Eubacterium sp.]
MAKAERYNDEPIILADGKVYRDGKLVFDAVKMQVNVHLRNWTGRTLASNGNRSTRITGKDIDGTMTERRNTKWTREMLKDIDAGKTPEFTIQGRIADKGSSYYKKYGSEIVTCVGCVLTGDIKLIDFDIDSDDVLTDEISFNVYAVDFKNKK